jgi:hypothetical protein
MAGAGKMRQPQNKEFDMRRKAIWVLIVVLWGGAILLLWHLHAASGKQPAARRIFPKVQSERLVWPSNHTWIWSVDMPPDGQKRQKLAVVARAVHTPLAAKESFAIRTRAISKQESEATLSFGSLGSGRSGPAMVSVQLIDLGEAAIPTSSPKGSLRLLLTLQKDGTETFLHGPETALEGSFAGFAENEGPWKDGELHLVNLFVKTEDRLTTFDVVVICSEQAPDALKKGTGDRP